MIDARIKLSRTAQLRRNAIIDGIVTIIAIIEPFKIISFNESLRVLFSFTNKQNSKKW